MGAMRDRCGRAPLVRALCAALLCLAAATASQTARGFDEVEVAAEVRDLVEGEILPREMRLADATRRLQNSVLRHCTFPALSSLGFVREAFARTIVSAAGVEPFAFIDEMPLRLPERFMTGTASTAFTRSRLAAMVAGSESPALSVADLEDEEPGLTGLPAIEFLLLAGNGTSGDEFERRCLMAQAIASGLRQRARRMTLRWHFGGLPAHWGTNPPPLGDRLRLRDLIQGGLDVADRLERALGAFDPAGFGVERLPFVDRGANLIYLDALMQALARHVSVLRMFAAPASPEDEVLGRVAETLDIARSRFHRDAPSGRDLGAVRPMVGSARLALVQELPEAFGFDASAFVKPLGTFAAGEDDPDGE